MVDGHFDNATDTWKDGREPIPDFTRDFGELSAAVSTLLSSVTIRGFAGTSYATLIRPDNIKRWAFLGGFDLHSASLIADGGPVPCSCTAAIRSRWPASRRIPGRTVLRLVSSSGHGKGVVFACTRGTTRDR